MRLRHKLLLVASCTLALPIAGWVYVRQMESLLRQGQEQALNASARAVTRSLVAIDAPLPPATPGWYVQRAVAPITVDGYADDWAPLTPWSQPLGLRGKLLLAQDANWLYFYAEVPTAHRQRADADDSNALRADHLILSLGSGGQRRRYLIASSAPGPTSARPLDPAAADLPDLLTAQWQEDGSGYRVEGRLPRALRVDQLGVGIYAPGTNDDPLAAEMRPLRAYSSELSNDLARLAPEHLRARLFDPDGWMLASSGRLDEGAKRVEDQPGWFASLIYRALLASPLQSAEPWTADAPRLQLPAVRKATDGTTTTLWREGETRGAVVLATVLPVQRHGKVIAELMLEQPSRTVPLLANRALFGLLLTSFGVLLLAGGALLLFAARLGMRLGRLRRAAELAQQHDGRLQGAFVKGRFPMVADDDEIGDLARSFEHLFEMVEGYTDYLRTLASKLSHELNTPLAIVKSSLDNLEQTLLQHQALPATARPYLARAHDGVARLSALVRAMSESSRMERAIGAAEPEDVDLVEVVRGCAAGYRSMLGDRRFELELPDAPLPLHGAPELIAQALDKLIDNALSFTPADGWLRLRLWAIEQGAQIELANQGPLLPPHMQGRLFDSLVSLRDKATPGEAPHLGLGLYVVRLIAERHGGIASARNLDDGSGVAFTLSLHHLPRARL